MSFIQETLVTEATVDAAVLVERIEHFGLAVHRRTVERALARSKKTTMIEQVASECMATVPDGHVLAEHYEALAEKPWTLAKTTSVYAASRF